MKSLTRLWNSFGSTKVYVPILQEAITSNQLRQVTNLGPEFAKNTGYKGTLTLSSTVHFLKFVPTNYVFGGVNSWGEAEIIQALHPKTTFAYMNSQEDAERLETITDVQRDLAISDAWNPSLKSKTVGIIDVMLREGTTIKLTYGKTSPVLEYEYFSEASQAIELGGCPFPYGVPKKQKEIEDAIKDHNRDVISVENIGEVRNGGADQVLVESVNGVSARSPDVLNHIYTSTFFCMHDIGLRACLQNLMIRGTGYMTLDELEAHKELLDLEVNPLVSLEHTIDSLLV